MIEMLKDHRGFRFGSSFSKPQQGVRSRLHSSGLKASGGGSRGGGGGGRGKGFQNRKCRRPDILDHKLKF